MILIVKKIPLEKDGKTYEIKVFEYINDFGESEFMVGGYLNNRLVTIRGIVNAYIDSQIESLSRQSGIDYLINRTKDEINRFC
ncbi:MAG: hypothetical protein KAT05_04260 [Spirochaetes bacterium]|nr:hypothetical protein [Spirochaetota bacterium]